MSKGIYTGVTPFPVLHVHVCVLAKDRIFFLPFTKKKCSPKNDMQIRAKTVFPNVKPFTLSKGRVDSSITTLWAHEGDTSPPGRGEIPTGIPLI